MSTPTIQQYLRALGRALRSREVGPSDFVREVGQHLHDVYERETAAGTSPARAHQAAIRRFGDVDEFANRIAGEAVLPRAQAGSATKPAPRPPVRRRRPRSPGVAYAVVSLVLVVVAGGLAMTSRNVPPPTIAEFAPQAVEQITAPADDAAGAAPDKASAGSADVEATRSGDGAGPPAADVARVRQCVGDPPRQIEDPQSPPCVPFWSGDNGGATSKGVGHNEVRIYIPLATVIHPALEAFFNRRFEFYGRRLRFIYGSSVAVDQPTQRAHAADAHAKEAFASGFYRGADGLYFIDELSRRRVIGVHGFLSLPSTHLAQRRPYVWSYPMASDHLFGNLGEWACNRLAGANAVHAGDEMLRSKPRTFGVVLHRRHADEPTDARPLEDALAACGQRVVLLIRNSSEDGDGSFVTTMLRLRDRGVTSVIFLGHPGGWGDHAKAASVQAYYPEWIISTYLHNNDSNHWVTYFSIPPEQRANAFGLTFLPKQVRVTNEPYHWAGCEVARCPDSFVAGPPEARGQIELAWVYRPLLLLASGIQMAGPNLTPETFERGLQSTTFPNPAHPNMAGSVGFQRGSYSMVADAAEIFWSNTARSPYAGDGPGAYCYVDGGVRHRRGSWPRGPDPFFREPCDSGT